MKILFFLLTTFFFLISTQTDLHGADFCLTADCSDSMLLGGSPDDEGTFQWLLLDITYFLSNIVIPALFGIALLVFIVNATRYFIIGGSDTGAQEKARRLALWSIIAFVFLVSLWGIVNLLIKGLDFTETEASCPDYLGNWCNSRGLTRSGSLESSYESYSVDSYTGSSDSLQIESYAGNESEPEKNNIYIKSDSEQELNTADNTASSCSIDCPEVYESMSSDDCSSIENKVCGFGPGLHVKNYDNVCLACTDNKVNQYCDGRCILP